MFTGGLQVQFYNVEPTKFLVSLQKGWDGMQAKDFLLEQKEVAKVIWDNHDYFPARKKKRRKKQKKKKDKKV